MIVIYLIVIKDKAYLEKVFPFLDSLKVLPVVINSPSILTLTLDEIKDRVNYIKSINEELVINNCFNPIFSLSRKKYLLRKENQDTNTRRI